MSDLGWYLTKYKIGDEFKIKDFHKKKLKTKYINNIAKLIKIEGCWCYLLLDGRELAYKGTHLEVYWDKI